MLGALIKKFAYRVEPGPNGGFIAHPAAPELGTLEGATREEVDRKIEDRLSELLGMPLATFKLSDIQHIQNPRLKVKIQTAAHGALSGMPMATSHPSPAQQDDTQQEEVTTNSSVRSDQSFTASLVRAKSDASQSAQNSSNQFGWNQPEPPPIAPEETSTTVLKVLIMVVIVLALVYYFLHR